MSRSRENTFASSLADSGRENRGNSRGTSGRSSRRGKVGRNRPSVGKRKDPEYKNCGFLLPVKLHDKVKYLVLAPETAEWLKEQCEEEGIRPGTYGRYGLSELAEILFRDWLRAMEEESEQES